MSLGGGLQGAAPEPAVNAKQFIVDQFGVSSVLAVNNITDPILIKEFLITKSPTETIIPIPTLWARINALGRRLTGGGNIRIGIIISDDGGLTWSQATLDITTSATFETLQASIDFENIGVDQNRLAVAAFNSDGVSTGEIKEIRVQFGYFLPLNWKIEEI